MNSKLQASLPRLHHSTRDLDDESSGADCGAILDRYRPGENSQLTLSRPGPQAALCMCGPRTRLVHRALLSVVAVTFLASFTFQILSDCILIIIRYLFGGMFGNRAFWPDCGGFVIPVRFELCNNNYTDSL